MRDIEDLPEDIALIAKRTHGTRRANAELISEMEKHGFEFEIAAAKLEHFMGSLVDAGVITEEFYWATALDWEESLQKQLRDAEAKIRRRIAQQRYEEQRAVSEILTPKPSKLIVPGRD